MKKRSSLVVIFCIVVSHFAFSQYKLYEDGVKKYKDKDFEGSINQLTSFLSKTTRDKKFDVDAYYYRALSYFKTDKFSKALGDFEDALLLNHTNKGNIYWFMGKCL